MVQNKDKQFPKNHMKYFDSSKKLLILCTHFIVSGSSSVGRASASQAEGREFEPRFPLYFSLISLFPISGVSVFRSIIIVQIN